MIENAGISFAIDDPRLFLMCRAAGLICALPAGSVAELLPPQMLAPSDGRHPLVTGIADVRGLLVPVANLDAILGVRDQRTTHLVLMRARGGLVGLVVADTVGMRLMPEGGSDALPPMLGEVVSDVIADIAASPPAVVRVASPRSATLEA